MKNRKKKLLKKCYTFFGIILLLSSCENHDEIIVQELQQKNKVTKISFDEFQFNTKSNTVVQEYQKFFDENQPIKNKSTQDESNISNNAVILTDEIIRIQDSLFTTYTFKILTQTPQNKFYNLVLQVDKNNEDNKSYILEYTPSQEWLGESFRGTVKISKDNIFNITNVLASKSSECVIGFHSYWECSFGNEHGPGECNGTSFDLTYVFEYGSCGQSTGGSSGTNLNGENNQNSGSGGSGGNIATSPVFNGVSASIIRVNSLIGPLHFKDKKFLKDNLGFLLDIEDFLFANNSNEAKNFAYKLTVAKRTSNYNQFFQQQIFIRNPYQIWNNITQQERDLIKQDPLLAFGVYENRAIAENATRDKFGVNGRNDRSDAFRHAYYNLINTKRVGIDAAVSFSNAHESETPLALIKEKQMDLFNNNIGHNSIVGNSSKSVSELADIIYQKLLNGDLIYLSPINNNDPNFGTTHGISSNTLLIPTN